MRTAAAEVLAAEIGIQRDVVRDIWIRRSWWKETKPFWTQEETLSFLDRHLCGDCKSIGGRNLDDACANCPINERKKSQAAAASRSAQKRMISQTKAEKLNAYQVRANCPRSHNQTREVAILIARANKCRPLSRTPFQRSRQPTRSSRSSKSWRRLVRVGVNRSRWSRKATRPGPAQSECTRAALRWKWAEPPVISDSLEAVPWSMSCYKRFDRRASGMQQFCQRASE